MRVALVTAKGVVLQLDGENKLHFIDNLDDIIQFEIDQRLFQYEPHFHYEHEPTISGE
jgi:hypothetical protein